MNAVLRDQFVVASISLDELSQRVPARVVAVQASDDRATPSLLRRLAEIGFLPGESVMIIGRGIPGGTPLAVRIGTSTFALRPAEASCVQVVPLDKA